MVSLPEWTAAEDFDAISGVCDCESLQFRRELRAWEVHPRSKLVPEILFAIFGFFLVSDGVFVSSNRLDMPSFILALPKDSYLQNRASFGPNLPLTAGRVVSLQKLLLINACMSRLLSVNELTGIPWARTCYALALVYIPSPTEGSRDASWEWVGRPRG